MTTTPATTSTAARRERFPSRVERGWRPWLLLWGVRASAAYVDLDASSVLARFGPWRLSVPLSDIEGYSITGPYRPIAALGVRMSIRNRDISFCGTARAGVCLRFRPGHEPRWMRFLRPPALTVTPDDIDGFVRALEARGMTGDDRRKR